MRERERERDRGRREEKERQTSSGPESMDDDELHDVYILTSI
jgi:hypothetical protein